MPDTKLNRWSGKKIILLTLFLILSSGGFALAWISFRADITRESDFANLEFEITYPKSPSACYINVNDSNYHHWPGFVNDDPFIGDDWETYWVKMEQSTDTPVKFNITNRSDREVYMRINIVPEWQTERITNVGAELVPILAPEAELRWLLKLFEIALVETPPPETQAQRYAAWMQVHYRVRLSSVIANNVYLNGEPTGAHSFYVYVLDKSSNKLAAIIPPNTPTETGNSVTFQAFLSKINEHMNIPESAHSLKLIFNLEVIQGTPEALAWAQDYTHDDVSVPWICDESESETVTWQYPFGPGSPTPPQYPPTRAPSPIPTVIPTVMP